MDSYDVQHDSDIRAIEFSPNGELLATGSHDRTVKLTWLDEDREPIVLLGHQDFVTSLAFTSDSSRLISGSEDGSWKIWAIEDGSAREVMTVEGAHSDYVSDIALDPEEHLLVTGGEDRTIRLWPSFPRKETEYPGDTSDSFAARVENYKREYWRHRTSDLLVD